MRCADLNAKPVAAPISRRLAPFLRIAFMPLSFAIATAFGTRRTIRRKVIAEGALVASEDALRTRIALGLDARALRLCSGFDPKKATMRVKKARARVPLMDAVPFCAMRVQLVSLQTISGNIVASLFAILRSLNAAHRASHRHSLPLQAAARMTPAIRGVMALRPENVAERLSGLRLRLFIFTLLCDHSVCETGQAKM
jgi:hypothetical protein